MGFAFTARDFLDLGSQGTVFMALSTLARLGKIRRISRGVYDYPRHSKLLGGLLAPISIKLRMPWQENPESESNPREPSPLTYSGSSNRCMRQLSTWQTDAREQFVSAHRHHLQTNKSERAAAQREDCFGRPCPSLSR